MNLHKLLLTQNACYLAGQTIVPKGIMVHSTGCNNPWLRRYVGPDDGLLGVNGNSNHWNTYHPDGRAVCVHGFIGKLADGTIATYQTLPWNYRGWHAGGAANNTFDGKGELLITIMSSLAQEESRSISENITWGQRKSFSDGKVHLPYKRFLGYEKGENGRPAVVEEEAAVVRLIYRLFLEGKTQAGICKYLEDLGIPSPGGKQKWSKTTVTSILQNEKYKGDALLQKKFTVDFLEKKMK